MSKKTQAAAMADELNRDRRGFRAGTINFWHLVPVRSDDWVYVVAGARAEGDRLDLAIADGMGDQKGEVQTTISIWEPDGLSASDESIEIRSAARVRWKDSDVQQPAKAKKDPALFLRRAPG